MALAVQNIFDKLESHALQTGYFDNVNSVEPKSAPGNGLNCAFWLENVAMIRSSGLSSGTARLEFTFRLYSSMLQQPQDAIDPNLLIALDAFYTELAGDFELGAEARMIDLLGAHGTGLQAVAGYLNQDSKMFRMFEITVPVIVNDVWEEEA